MGMAKLFRTALVILLIAAPASSRAQQTITLKKLWIEPQVTVLFGDYRLLFTIKDIEKAMQLLPTSDQALYGASAALDKNRTYTIELLPGRRTEYRFPLQGIMQNAVGGFLLYRGHAAVMKGRHKELRSIDIKFGPPVDMDGYSTVSVTAYDPKDGAMIFSGVMNAEMYYKDLGLD